MKPIGTAACVAAGVLWAGAALAVSPKYWIHDSAEEFLGGEVEGVSVTSDGSLRLAPVIERRTEPDVPYVWDAAVTRDGKTTYVGTGDDGWILEVRGDEAVNFFQCAAFEVLSVAVDDDGVVYAGTAPEGFVYRIEDGEGDVLFDAEENYIWDLVMGPDGKLYAAAGPGGAVYRMDPRTGDAEEFFRTEDNHVVTLAFDDAGNLLLGTEGRGLVVRVAPDGTARVLYDCPQGEVGAVLAGADGTVWAAAASAAEVREEARRDSSEQADGDDDTNDFDEGFLFEVTPTGGDGILYRIDAEGNASRYWNSGQGTIFDLADGGDGTVLVATGQNGAVYRVRQNARATLVLDADADQVISLVPLPDGRGVSVATANPSAVFRMGLRPGKSGVYRSEVLDARQLATWGRIDWQGEKNGGRVALAVRTGNTDEPDGTWSPWKELGDERTSLLDVDKTRFLQWRAELRGGSGAGPEIRRVRVSSRENNVAPMLFSVQVIPSGTRFYDEIPELRPRPLYQALPGGVKVQYQFDNGADLEFPAEQRAPWTQGLRQVQWEAVDPNGDTLVYDLAFRREDESRWKIFAEDVEGKNYVFNGNGVPDGEYRIRVTASDRRSNPQDERTQEIVSEPFIVDNTAPGFRDLRHERRGEEIRITGAVFDGMSDVVRLESSLNGDDWVDRSPTDGIFDSSSEGIEFRVTAPAGEEHSVLLRGTDNAGNLGSARVLIRP